MELKYNKEIKGKSPLKTILGFQIFKERQNFVFQYSKYVNGKPGSGKTEYRETNTTKDIVAFYGDLENIINNLTKDVELAIHSIVRKGNVKNHIPLIDFATPPEGDLFHSMDRLQEEFNYDIYLFKTGRSYHAYLDALLSDAEWRKFLGRLLLLNKADSLITDSRWIGHSLKQGFSSLRLSCNTPLYLQYPTFWQSIPKKSI